MRATIATTLKTVIHDGRSLSRETPRLRAALGSERDTAFALACIYGVLRNYFSLAARLQAMLEKPLRRKDADIETLLLSALYQISHMQVPAHAAVSSNVEAARVLNKKWACGLVNAVLRRASKSTAATVPDSGPVHFEHPQWLIDQTARDWPQDWRAILAANNQHPPQTLRVNQLQVSRADYLEQLAAAGLSASATRFSAHGIVLDEPLAVERLPGFSGGAVSVQDEAAQLACGLLELGGSERVLDACAAPGGKTTHILEHLAGRGELLALDHDAERLADVERNVKRLGLTCQLLHADAGAPDLWWDGQEFQCILLDAPCSATGVIRRHPDIRFHRRATDIAGLCATQQRLLEKLWPLLDVGGTLLYVTCSVLAAENDEIIERVLAMNEALEVATLDVAWGRATRYGRQILPGENDMDGFYFARLRKTDGAS